MFQIIKTSRSKMQELQYLELASKGSSPPPTLLLKTTYPGNGTKRQFVKVNEEMFVSEIKKRPILYNTTMKDHKRFSTRHEAWAEVAVAMNLSEQECKKRWRSLRDAFMKVVRNKNEEEQKTWIHYRLLEFLLPFIGKKGKRSREIECMEGFDNDDDDAEYVEFEEGVELFKSSREPITVSYVTEDGEEVFQMLQDPDNIPEGAVIGIEETEDEDEIEEEERMFHDNRLVEEELQPNREDWLSPRHQINGNSNGNREENSENFLYEERLDSTMLDIQQSYEMPAQHSYAQNSVKLEALSEGDSEIHVEEIEMESVISEHPDEGSVISEHKQPESIHQNFEKQVSSEQSPECHESSSCVAPESITVSSPEPVASEQTTQELPSASPVQLQSSVREDMHVHIGNRTPEQTSKAGCGDSDERFLLSCAPILRRLPNKKNQLARLRIQQLLFELEYDEKYSS
ncbi:uncharacterized protein LOC131430746 [Malaya genurostris]|uniref:uncharacterized protein LOC131430746 n=1 Tax=Malaya genurostris TaxID=325434 RepID=UPI0026F3C087|nr:uncharacterized protein LOC131430746 [Malaya genurostris]